MKKTFYILASIALLSFVAEKTITVKFSEPQINYHWQNLENIKVIADQSNMSHAQVKYIINAIDSLQKDIQKNISIDSNVAPTPKKK
jgi:hypothetical protein